MAVFAVMPLPDAVRHACSCFEVPPRGDDSDVAPLANAPWRRLSCVLLRAKGGMHSACFLAGRVEGHVGEVDGLGNVDFWAGRCRCGVIVEGE